MRSLILVTPTGSYQSNISLIQSSVESILGYPAPLSHIVGQEDSTISIDHIREIKLFLQTSPPKNRHKVVVIPNSAHMSIPAQHAILKILEEPPSYALIVLACSNFHHLLPTITSRCIIKPVKSVSPSQEPQSDNQNTHLLSNLSKQQKISASLSRNKTQALDFLLRQIYHLNTQLKHQSDKTTLFNLTLALYTYKLLQQNTNPQHTLNSYFARLRS